MITWLTGNTGAGKTTLARKIQTERPKIILDGDEMRSSINRDLGLSIEDREENCIRIARLAVVLETQGFDIVVAVICPFEYMRCRVREITNCRIIYLPYVGDNKRSDAPYERPRFYHEMGPIRDDVL